MKKNLTLLTILSLAFFSVSAQDDSKESKGTVRITIETGTNFFNSKYNDPDFIRQNSSDYAYEPCANELKSFSYNGYVGLKAEVLFASRQVSLTTGARYTRYRHTLNAGNFWNDDDFFYFRVQGSSVNTDYYRIEEMKQVVDYIGIPVELKLLPAPDRRCRFFLKAGCVFNFKVEERTRFDFVYESMEKYGRLLERTTGKAQDFHSVLYAGIGFEVGKPGKSSFIFEIPLPVYYLTDETTLFTQPRFGMGLQLGLSIPLN